jgi:hypothetical protein
LKRVSERGDRNRIVVEIIKAWAMTIKSKSLHSNPVPKQNNLLVVSLMSYTFLNLILLSIFVTIRLLCEEISLIFRFTYCLEFYYQFLSSFPFWKIKKKMKIFDPCSLNILLFDFYSLNIFFFKYSISVSNVVLIFMILPNKMMSLI